MRACIVPYAFAWMLPFRTADIPHFGVDFERLAALVRFGPGPKRPHRMRFKPRLAPLQPSSP